MSYFLTVANNMGDYLHRHERYDGLNDAIEFIARHYLKDPGFLRYWTGNISIRDGQISRVLIRRSPHTDQLRENIAYIYLVNEQALREIEEHDPDTVSRH